MRIKLFKNNTVTDQKCWKIRYEGRSITLDNENLKDFCSNQLNLELQNRSNHQHIYSNVLSQYKFDQEGFKYDYSVKELVLLAIAANDKLVEQYQDFLFAEENLSLLPLLVGNQKYIEAFIEKFHGTDGVYGRLKGQAIQLVEPNKIGFFSVIALRKEQKLLETVFVEYVLRDFGQVLKTSKPDPLYGVLETASLIKNEEFITIVLDAFERYINEPTKKASTEELLKKSFATLLETAISQEHISVIEYLCKRYTNSADHAIYDVYEQAFADDKVITILKQQILKNIGARGRKEIYDLILKTALDAGNIAFIEHLCEKCAECNNDVINYLDHKLKNNEFDNTCESTLVALSNTGSQDIIVNILARVQIYQNILNNKQQVFRQIIQNILRNTIKEASYEVVVLLCQHVDLKSPALQAICKEEFEKALPVVAEQLEKTSMELFPSMTRNEYQKNRGTLNNLYLIRSLLESSKLINTSSKANIQTQTDTQVNKGSSNNAASPIVNVEDTSAMIGETATSNQVVDEENNNRSQNPAPKNQQPQENIVDKGKNIMNNEKASIEEAIGNDCEEGKMHSSDQNTKTIEEALSDAIFSLDCKEVRSLVEQVKQEGNNVERIINGALKEANETKVGKKDKESLDKIKKIREFLAKEFKSIAASPVDDSVESIGATTSSHEAPVIEPKESEGNQPDSLSSEDDDYSRLESDKSAGASSGSGSPFEEVPSIATKEAKVNDEQSDNINGDDLTPVSSPVSGDVLTSRSDEEEPVVITTRQPNDGEHDKTVPEEYQDDALEKDLIDFSSDDDNSLLGDPVPTSTNEISGRTDGTQTTTRQKEDSTPPLVLPAVPVLQKQGGVQPLPTDNENVSSSNRQKNPCPAPTPVPTRIPPVVENESKQADDTLTNGKLPNNPGNGSITAAQNTQKSNWPTVATWTFAVAGILAGAAAPAAYFAFSVSLLTTGIIAGVAACCLVAAAVIYCCTPKNQVENNKVDKPFNTKKASTTVSV